MSKGLPGVHGKIKPTGKLSSIKNGEVKESLTPQEVKALCGSDKSISFDISASYFLINDQSFLSTIAPNSLKDIDLSSNELSELTLLNNQSKLKRIVADKNCISKLSFQNLISAKHISLCYNNIEFIPDMSDLKKILYVSFRGNKITGGFENLAAAKTLKFLDLSKNDLDLTLNELYEKIILPLQTLPKLQYLNLEANPMVNKIRNFKLFVVFELPKLEYFNGEKITKEERSSAAQLDAAGAFNAKTQKAQSIKPMRNIILTTRVEEEEAHDEDKNQLLEELLTKEESTESSENHSSSLIHTQSLRNLLSSLDYLDSHDIGSINTNSSMIDASNELNTNVNFNSYLNHQSAPSFDSSDPLDDILNYLEDPNNSIQLNPIPTTSSSPLNTFTMQEERKPMGGMELASSHSVTNAAVAIEDDIDYMDLLSDVIPTDSSPLPDHHPEDDTLSALLDELHFNSPQTSPLPTSSPHPTSLSLPPQQHNEDQYLDSLLDEMIEGYTPQPNPLLPPPSLPPPFCADELLDELLSNDFGGSSMMHSTSNDNFTEMAKMLEQQQQQAMQAEMAIREQLKQTELEAQRRREALLLQRKLEEEERIRREEEYRKLEEDRRVQEEEQRKREEEQRMIRQLKEEEERRAREEELRQMEEEIRAREEERRRQLEEEHKAMEEERRRALEAERLRREEEDKRRREEEDRQRREEEERIRLAQEENERLMNERIRLLEEEQRKLDEEIQHRRFLELERKRLEEEEYRRLEAERARKEEDDRQRALLLQRQSAELQRLKLAEEQQKKAFEEEERKLREALEHKRLLLLKQQQDEEERKRKESEELLLLLEKERLEDEQHKKRLAEEEKRKFNDANFVDSIVQHLSSDAPSAPYHPLHPIIPSDLSNDPHAIEELSKCSFPYAIDPVSIQIYESLGVGSFGSVSRGILNLKEVTVKLLKCNLNNDPSFLTLFKNEVALLAVLKHPNLVDLIGITLKELSAVCEYIQGTPLFGLLRNKGIVWDIKERLAVIRQIGEGLEYLHSQNIIFRGLKSKNVIITSTNQVKMRDYGLHEVKKFVKANGGIGTPQYDAPEIILDRPYSIAADIFSFGILMWEIFAQQTPYQEMMARQVMVAVTQQHLRPPTPVDCPIVLWKLMNACWADDPSARPDIAKVNRILSQPLDQLLKYGMTPGSSEPLPRGVPPPSPLPSSPAPTLSPSSTPSASPIPLIGASSPPLSQVDEVDPKVHAVIGQITQMLSSSSFDIQSKALKALLNISKTEGNVKAIGQSKVIPSLLAILQGLPSPNDLLIEAASRVISSLCENPIAEKEAREKAINQTLVTLITTPPTDLSDVTIVQVIKAITTMAYNGESQVILRSSGVIPPLIQYLSSPNDHIRLQSVWAFSNLLEDEVAQEDFSMNGGVKALLQQLASPNPGIQFRTLVALGNLMTNAKVFPIITKANILPRFLQLLQSKSAPLRLQAVKATERFSRKGTLREEITKQGGMQSLVQLLDPANDPELISIALSTLSHFTGDQSQLVNFKRANGLHAVVQLLSHSNPSIQSDALSFFYTFINQSEINKEIARAISFIPKCIGLMTSPHASMQLLACKAIADLSKSDKCIETIFAGGALAPSIGLLDSPSDDVHDAVLFILSKLLSFDPVAVKQAIMTAVVLPKMLAMLRCMRQSIKESAAFILADLTDNPKAQLYLRAQKALPLFSGIIQTSADQPLLEKLLFAISNFAANSEHHAAMRESDLFPALILHLNSENVAIQRSVVKSMLSLCSSPENKDDLVRANAVNALRLLSTSSTKALQLAAAKCIGFLSL